jgi:hypothetical protein
VGHLFSLLFVSFFPCQLVVVFSMAAVPHVDHSLERIRFFVLFSPGSVAPLDRVQTLFPPTVSRETLVQIINDHGIFEITEDGIVRLKEITPEDEALKVVVEDWKDNCHRFLKPTQDLELCHLASEVPRPANVPRHCKLKDILRSDGTGRFQVFGNPESLFVRRMQTPDEVEELCERWRSRLATYMFKMNLKTMTLTEIGSAVSRPRQLYRNKGLLEVIQGDTLGRFRLSGEGNYIRVFFDKKAYLTTIQDSLSHAEDSENGMLQHSSGDTPDEGWTTVARPPKTTTPIAPPIGAGRVIVPPLGAAIPHKDTFAARLKAGKPPGLPEPVGARRENGSLFSPAVQNTFEEPVVSYPVQSNAGVVGNGGWFPSVKPAGEDDRSKLPILDENPHSPFEAYFGARPASMSPFLSVPPTAVPPASAGSELAWMGIVDSPSFLLDQPVSLGPDIPAEPRKSDEVSAVDIQVTLKEWLPIVLSGFPENLIDSFVEKLGEEGFVLVQDLIIAQSMDQLSLDYLREFGFKLGHYNRLITALGSVKR